MLASTNTRVWVLLVVHDFSFDFSVFLYVANSCSVCVAVRCVLCFLVGTSDLPRGGSRCMHSGWGYLPLVKTSGGMGKIDPDCCCVE